MGTEEDALKPHIEPAINIIRNLIKCKIYKFTDWEKGDLNIHSFRKWFKTQMTDSNKQIESSEVFFCLYITGSRGVSKKEKSISNHVQSQKDTGPSIL